MRIALVHIRHAATGGTERHLDQLAGYLAEHGHEVFIVCRKHGVAPHPAIRFVVIRPPALGASFRLWAFARAVQRHVEQADYDVVLGLGRTWSQDVLRLGGGCHATYLETCRPGRALRMRDRLILHIERRALGSGAARVIVNSEMVRRDVQQRFALGRENVHIIYNSVDTARFERRRYTAAAHGLRRDLGIGGNAPVVLFVGNGFQRKGLQPLLDAIAELRRVIDDIHLLVVGDDPHADFYGRSADRLGIADRTRFLGSRADAEVCYAASDLFVLPTRYDPFANATLEALASGLSVVTTSTNGASEVLDTTGDQPRGAVLSAGWTKTDLAQAVRTWLPVAREAASRQRACATAARFPVERAARATLDVLESATRQPRASAATHRSDRPPT